MKRNAKQILGALLSLLILATCFAACGKTESGLTDPTADGGEKKALSVVTTIFPEYDWVRRLLNGLEEKSEVRMLLDKGVDLHNFQPGVDDILAVRGADLFIYVGGASDAWVKDVLTQAGADAPKSLNLLETLGERVREEEVKPGMQAEDEEEETDETEYDEHVWLSLKNAEILVNAIADALAEADAEDAAAIKANAAAYTEELRKLDARYEETVSAAGTKYLLFADRFPFRYMMDDYGLDYSAAFVGCATETQAKIDTITFLAAKADEKALKNVIVLEGSDQSIAEKVIESTQAKDLGILTMNSMQSVTAADVEAGADYLALMEKNLETLTEALG